MEKNIQKNKILSYFKKRFILYINKIAKEILNFSFLSPETILGDYQDLIINFQSLRESLQNTYENYNDYMVSIYFEYLPTGANINVNKDVEIWPASLIKIPIAMVAMKKVQDKQWQLDNALVILDEDKDSEFGDLYKQPTGTVFSIEDLIKESIVNSDNTAHFVLLRNIESSELENVFEHLGLIDELSVVKNALVSEESMYDNKMSAKNYSVFFRSLYNATFLNPEYSQLFLKFLTSTRNEFLELGIPSNIPFAHKTGIRDQELVWADSGIVYVPNRPYLLTVMIQKKSPENVSQQEVDMLFKNISEEIYAYVTQAQ